MRQRLPVAGWLLVCGLMVLAGVTWQTSRYQPRPAPPPPSAWTALHHQPAPALSAPQPLADGVLWSPPGQNAFIYEFFDGRPPVVLDGLAGTPQTVTVFRAGLSDTYHLIWGNDRAELWHARLNADGTFALPPVRLVAAHSTFQAGPRPDGGAVVVWQGPLREGQPAPLHYILLDGQGRPYRDDRLLADARHFGLATSQSDRLTLAWTSPTAEPDNLLVARLFLPALESLAPPDPTAEARRLPLAAPAEAAWLAELAVVQGQSGYYVAWGHASAAQPEHVRYQVWASADADAEPRPLQLAADSSSPRLRWLGQVRGDDLFNQRAYLSLTAYLDGAWRAVLVNLGDASSAGWPYQVLGEQAANAAAPLVWLSAEESIQAAWVTLDPTQGLTAVAVTNSLPSPSPSPLPPFTFERGLLALRFLPYGLLWVVPAALIWIFNGGPGWLSGRASLPLMVGSYWLPKLALAGDWLHYVPPGVQDTPLIYGLLVGLAAVLPVAGLAPFWQPSKAQLFGLGYLALEASLTLFFFGANL